jgi:histone-lysine N-methyltransferase SETMAR
VKHTPEKKEYVKMTKSDFAFFKPIVQFLYHKNKTTREVEKELRFIYGSTVPEFRTIQEWFKEIREKEFYLDDADRSGAPKIPDVTKEVKLALKKKPFASTRAISLAVEHSRETVKDRLLHELKLKQRDPSFHPHDLYPSSIDKRMEFAGNLARLLKLLKPNGWRNLFTGDETWVYFSNPPGKIWLNPEEKRPSFPQLAQDSEKVFITIFFNGQKVWLLSSLDTEETMDATTFIDNILTPLHRLILKDKSIFKPWYIHYDNAPAHRATETKEFLTNRTYFRLVPHPPYSPDLAPADFFLNSYLKYKLRGNTYENKQHLMRAIKKILKKIPPSLLQSTFENWIERCEYVAETGLYYNRK